MKKLLLVVVAVVVIYFIPSCTFKKAQPEFRCDSIVHYTPTIKSIIVSNCVSCHDASSSYGNFNNVAELQAKAVGGQLLQQVVTARTMPQGGSLSEADINKIHCWIVQGGLNN